MQYIIDHTGTLGPYKLAIICVKTNSKAIVILSFHSLSKGQKVTSEQ